MGLLIANCILGLWAVSLGLLLQIPIEHIPTGLIPVAMLWQMFLYTGLFITAHDAMHGAVCPGYPIFTAPRARDRIYQSPLCQNAFSADFLVIYYLLSLWLSSRASWISADGLVAAPIGSLHISSLPELASHMTGHLCKSHSLRHILELAKGILFPAFERTLLEDFRSKIGPVTRIADFFRIRLFRKLKILQIKKLG